MNSGIPNFLAVAVALSKIGYKPLGIRLDSGDLAEQSKQSRAEFFRISELFHVDLRNLNIVASNDIHEAVLRSLNDKGHSIDTFGIGTHLVTCKAQPALGCVYKLVSIDGHPRIKLSQEISKVTIPGKKKAYRLYNQEGFPFVDLMMFDSESPPLSGEKFLCRHPFDSKKRYLVTPSRVEPLYQIYWDGNYVETLSSIEDIKQRCSSQISSLPEKHTRFPDPVPYLVTLSDELFQFMHNLWEKECPIPEFF